jgi:hypothetical protein
MEDPQLTPSMPSSAQIFCCTSSSFLIGVCCRRASSEGGSMEAAFCIKFCNEIRASDAGTSRTGGALHAGASPAASELMLLDHPVLAVLTICRASARSWLKSDCERYSALHGLR